MQSTNSWGARTGRCPVARKIALSTDSVAEKAQQLPQYWGMLDRDSDKRLQYNQTLLIRRTINIPARQDTVQDVKLYSLLVSALRKVVRAVDVAPVPIRREVSNSNLLVRTRTLDLFRIKSWPTVELERGAGRRKRKEELGIAEGNFGMKVNPQWSGRW